MSTFLSVFHCYVITQQFAQSYLCHSNQPLPNYICSISIQSYSSRNLHYQSVLVVFCCNFSMEFCNSLWHMEKLGTLICNDWCHPCMSEPFQKLPHGHLLLFYLLHLRRHFSTDGIIIATNHMPGYRGFLCLLFGTGLALIQRSLQEKQAKIRR